MTEMTMTGSAAREHSASRSWVSALPGTLFAVAFAVSAFLYNTPDETASDKAWIDWYGDRGHRVAVLVSGYLLLAAGMLLIAFFAQVHRRIGGAAGTRNPLALLAGTASGVLVALSGLVAAALPGSTIFGSLPVPRDAALLHFTFEASFVVAFVGGLVAAAVAIAAITREARRTGYFGRPMAVSGYVAAVAGVASVMFFPAVVVLVWVVAVSVVLARRPALS